MSGSHSPHPHPPSSSSTWSTSASTATTLLSASPPDLNLRSTFTTASPASILSDLSSLEQEHASNSHTRRITSKLSTLLSSIDRFGSAIDVISNVNPEVMSLLWGGFRIFIVIVKSFNGFFERMGELLGQLVSTLPRIEEYVKLFPRSSMLSDSVSLYYNEIFQFCTRAVGMFQGSIRRTTFKIARYSLWKDFETLFESSIKNLSRYRKEVEKQAELAQMVQLGQFIQDFNISKNGDGHDRSGRVEKFTSALQPLDPEADLRSLLKMRMRNTCRWILSDAHFTEWVNKLEGGDVLWIHGIPGCGKSVLAATIVSELRNRSFSGTLFFFVSFRDDRKVECKKILASLLRQVFDEEDEEAVRVVEEEIRDVDLEMEPATEVVEGVLLRLLERRKGVKVVIDGLDECNEEEYLRLTSFITTAAKNTGTGFVVLSRHIPAISTAFKEYPHVEITTSSTNDDMASYIASFLSSTQDLDDTLIQKARTTLLENSQGMFLWIRLMVAELKTADSVWEFEQILERKAVTLSDAYERVIARLERMGSERRKVTAYKILAMVVTAMRPLTLEEVSCAIAIWDDEGTTEILEEKRKLRNPRGTVEELCGPLVEFRGSDDRRKKTGDWKGDDAGETKVVFVHATVKEFLAGRFMEARPGFVNHGQLARICLANLAFEECLVPPVGAVLGESYDVTVAAYGGLIDKQPFLRYAVTYFWYHVVECDISPIQQQLRTFLERKVCSVTWWCTFLYLTTYEGRDARWLSVLLPYVENLKSLLPVRSNPTNLTREVKETAQMLVNWTLPPDIVHVMRFNATDWLPSAVACFWNYASLLPELVEREREKQGQCLSPSGRGGPLQAAAAADAVECIEVLLKMGISPIVEEEVGYQPLHYAAYCNRVRSLDLLLKNGADPKLLSIKSMGNTPLHDTVHTGALEAAEILVAHDPGLIAVENVDGLTPLEYACEHKKWRFARLFVRQEEVIRGMEAERRDRALLFCAENGMDVVAEKLRWLGAVERGWGDGDGEVEERRTSWEDGREERKGIRKLKRNR